MIYTFHELNDSIKNIKFKKDDILRFDDGHISILNNINLIKDLPNQKIVFITPIFVPFNSLKTKKIFKNYYMDDFFIYRSREQFLSIDQIYNLLNNYNFQLGMHSYNHDITYVPKSNLKEHIRHMWHTYKIPIEKQKTFFSIYYPKSRLSVPGIRFDKNLNNFIKNGKIKKYKTIKNLNN